MVLIALVSSFNTHSKKSKKFYGPKKGCRGSLSHRASFMGNPVCTQFIIYTAVKLVRVNMACATVRGTAQGRFVFLHYGPRTLGFFPDLKTKKIQEKGGNTRGKKRKLFPGKSGIFYVLRSVRPHVLIWSLGSIPGYPADCGHPSDGGSCMFDEPTGFPKRDASFDQVEKSSCITTLKLHHRARAEKKSFHLSSEWPNRGPL